MEVFDSEETNKLKAILNLILPKGDTDMPEATLVLDKLDKKNISHSKFIEAGRALCNKVDQIENQEELDAFKRKNFRDFSNFVNLFLIAYYSTEEVLKKLKVGSIPPFPEGNYVKEGDIYLLEQVFLKEKIYKD